MELYEKPYAEMIEFQTNERIMDLGGLGDLELHATPGSNEVEEWSLD